MYGNTHAESVSRRITNWIINVRIRSASRTVTRHSHCDPLNLISIDGIQRVDVAADHLAAAFTLFHISRRNGNAGKLALNSTIQPDWVGAEFNLDLRGRINARSSVSATTTATCCPAY